MTVQDSDETMKKKLSPTDYVKLRYGPSTLRRAALKASDSEGQKKRPIGRQTRLEPEIADWLGEFAYTHRLLIKQVYQMAIDDFLQRRAEYKLTKLPMSKLYNVPPPTLDRGGKPSGVVINVVFDSEKQLNDLYEIVKADGESLALTNLIYTALIDFYIKHRTQKS